MPDAVVIGAGPNGLVAANVLADAGWEVEVLEAAPEPGGAVKTAELTEPGFHHDVFSAFYPLAAASPAIRALELDRYGLRWRRGELALAHPASDGTCAVLSTDLDETAASLDAFAAGDGESWRRLFALWGRVGDAFLDTLVTPFPPVRAGVRIGAKLGPHDALRFARMALLPVRRLADENFRADGGARLLAGNALHADFLPESAFSGFSAWLLTCLGQDVGFPFPEGGAGRLTDALVARLRDRGATLRCDAPVDAIVVRGGRAAGVRVKGDVVGARRAVLADVTAPALYLDLVGEEHLPRRVIEDLRRFEWDTATVKIDWALDGPVPWAARDARRAPVVHLGDSLDELSVYAGELARGRVPERPLVVFGQYAAADPSRCPPGKEVAWAYSHVPRGAWRDDDRDEHVARVEQRIEELAPGFMSLVRARHVLTPADLEQRDPNLVSGAINAGTAQLHQQLIFRPVPGLGRPETPIRGLYLASASAHPGGGVHGAPGAIAARAVLSRERAKRAAVAVAAGGAALAAARSVRSGLQDRRR